MSPINVETGAGSCQTGWVMPRTARQAPGQMFFHVLNRGNARDGIFDDEADYLAFEKVLLETQEQMFAQILERRKGTGPDIKTPCLDLSLLLLSFSGRNEGQDTIYCVVCEGNGAYL